MITELIWNGIQGIVLDAVGTLIDPFPPVAEVYADAARRQGVPIEADVVRSRFRRQFRDDERDEARGTLVTDEPTEWRRWRRIVAGVLPELPDPERGFRELWDHFGRADAWRCFDDVGPALRVFREEGLAVRIASNFDARLRRVVAGLPALSGYTDALVISSEVGYRKPHPAFFEAARARLGLPPECVLCVGDDPDNDAHGARRAGLRGVLLDRHGKRPGELPFVTDLAELAALRRR